MIYRYLYDNPQRIKQHSRTHKNGIKQENIK